MNYINNFLNENCGVVLKYFDKSNKPKIKLIGNHIYKSIEINKSSVGKSGIIFLEPLVMNYAKEKGVPSPTVISWEQSDDLAIFVTKRINGQSGEELVKSHPHLENKLQEYASYLKLIYHNIGLDRDMHLKDLIFDIKDDEIISATPVDFERIIPNQNLDIDLLFQIVKDMNLDSSTIEESLKSKR